MTLRKDSRIVRPAAFVLFVVLGAVVAAHLAYTCFGVGRASHADFFDRWPVLIGLLAVIALCALRAATQPAQRGAWIALGGAAMFWLAQSEELRC